MLDLLKTAFLPNFPRTLFGSAKSGAADRLESQRSAIEDKGLLELGSLFGRFLPQEKIFAKPATGAGSKERIFTPQVTFWAFLHQVLTRGMPCRDAVRKVQGLCAERKREIPDDSTSAFCQARSRLDTDRHLLAHSHLVGHLDSRASAAELWCGRSVKVIDGTGVSMPDTEANQGRWPQNASQKPGCGFPAAKIVGCFSLEHGGLLAWTLTDQFHHESKVWREMWGLFGSGDVALTDRGFCSYGAIAQLKARGVDSVMRLHQARKVDFRRGKRLGDGDRIQVWERPQHQNKHIMSAQQWAQLPEQLEVRTIRLLLQVSGFRTSSIVIVTTLLDAARYPASALCELYFRRWNVELHFRDIKVSLGLDVLRCKTPDMVAKEINMHAIAYNTIRAVMQAAASSHHQSLSRMSFKGTTDTVREWAPLFSARKSKRKKERLYAEMISIVASDKVPQRPMRSEPRAKKRRPKIYQLMTSPRGEMAVSPSRKLK
ncbi:MAG: IS4 family transposase [Verrucomicrobiales bacterium]